MRVDGKTMEESCGLVADACKNVQTNITQFTASIVSTANSIYVAQSQELAEYEAKQAQEAQQN